MKPLNIISSGRIRTDGAKRNDKENRFLYLFQVGECLSDYLMENETLGGWGQFDVLVLSFKRKCGKNPPPHIRYIDSGRPTTWTTGRNFLYNYAKNMPGGLDNYLYYIFADQDIKLINNLDYAESQCTKETWDLVTDTLSPFRKFERFLVEYRPALGFGHVGGETRGVLNYGVKRNFKIRPYYSQLDVDALFNAFHRDVISDLLPYNDSMEHVSWWMSQIDMQCKLFYRYHAHAVKFVPIHVRNTEHTRYPQGKVVSFLKMCQKERLSAPEALRDADSELSVKWLHLPHNSPLRPPVYDYVVPPKTAILKYNTMLEVSRHQLDKLTLVIP